MALYSMVALVVIGVSTVGVLAYRNSRFPNAAEQALLNTSVPLAMKHNCTRDTEAEQDTLNVQASVSCTSDVGGADRVVFTKFTSANSLDSQYRAFVAASGIDQNSGNCLDADRAEGTYISESNKTSGRTACYQQRGSSFIVWTDNLVQTLAHAIRVDRDYMKLRDWWADVEGLPNSAEFAAEAQAQKQAKEAPKAGEGGSRIVPITDH